MEQLPVGSVSVLSVGEGDLTLTFDKDKPAERERAKKVVTDMLARGYAILIQVGEKDGEPLYQRAKGFDPDTCEYLIVGVAEVETPEPSPRRAEPVDVGPVGASATPSKRRGRPRKLTTERVPAESTRTVAVARTAGG